MANTQFRSVSLLLAMIAGCADIAEVPSDDEDSWFADGAADGFSVRIEGTIADQMVSLANSMSAEELEVVIGLRRAAIESLLEFRRTQKRPLRSLRELDSLPNIKNRELERFRSYAESIQKIAAAREDWFGLDCQSPTRCAVPEDFEPLEHLNDAHAIARDTLRGLQLENGPIDLGSISRFGSKSIRYEFWSERADGEAAISIVVEPGTGSVYVDPRRVLPDHTIPLDALSKRTLWTFGDVLESIEDDVRGGGEPFVVLRNAIWESDHGRSTLASYTVVVDGKKTLHIDAETGEVVSEEDL